MPKRRSPLRDRLEKAALDAVRGVLGTLTIEEAGRAGRRLGAAAAPVLASRARLARTNLERAFPERDPRERDDLLRAVFEHFGGLFFELVRAAEEPLEDLLARVEVRNLDTARRAFGSGRGVLFVTPHLGNWEYAAVVAAALGCPMTVIARPLDNPLLEPLLAAFRTRSGNAVLPKADAGREILRTLRRGGAIGILPDQHARPPDAVAVPFFGRPASTTTAVARLADRTEALVLTACCVRAAEGRWLLTFDDPLDPRALAPVEREPAALTTRINLALERQIRAFPSQWLWLHNRWRLD